jgi:hypothetical protein
MNTPAEAIIEFIQAPKLYLISRQALAHNLEGVKDALKMADIAGAFATSDIDAHLVTQLDISNVMGVNRPFVIVADFPFDIAMIAEGGKVIPGELVEKSKEPVQ